MKFTTLQENLIRAISQASRFASTKAQLPILSYLKISANKTKIEISSTNLEISVSAQIGAKIDDEGEICIPAKVISELVNNFPKENVNFESSKEQLKISTSGFSGTILGTNSSDFPRIPNSILGEKYKLPKKEFIEGLNQVMFAASVDETRPVLTGILFIWQKGQVTLVATDGFRLSQKKIIIPEAKEGNLVILPKLILSELIRSAEEVDEILVNFSEKEKQAIFGLGETFLSSRLLEGEYPDFEKILPKSSSIKILVDKEELSRAVKLASVFARDSANIIKIKVLPDSLKVTAESGSAGSQETKIDAKVDSSEKDFEIAFNYHFLEDFLHSVTGEEVKMEFSGVSAPGVFLDTSDNNYLHLIMPVKLQG